MLSRSQLRWHAFSPALVKRQIVCVSAPDFLFGGGRRQHDLQEASGKGEGGKNRRWLDGGICSAIVGGMGQALPCTLALLQHWQTSGYNTLSR